MSYIRITTTHADGREQSNITHLPGEYATEAFEWRVEVVASGSRPYTVDTPTRTIHLYPTSHFKTHQYIEFADGYEEFAV